MGIEDVLLQQLQSILWTHPEAYAKSHAVISQQKIIFNVLPHDNVECKELEAAWTAKGFLNITTIISNCPLILYFGGTYFIPGQNKQRKNWKVEEGWQGSVKGGGKGETEAHSTTINFGQKHIRKLKMWKLVLLKCVPAGDALCTSRGTYIPICRHF